MQMFHNYHHSKVYKMLHSDFGKFDFSIWLHVFARSLIVVFIPIFLLQMGFSLREVLIYYLIYHICDVPLNFVAKLMVEWRGARQVIMMGVFCLIGYFIVLFNLSSGAWGFLVLMAFLSALYDSFFFVAHIYFFMECSHKQKDFAKKTSVLYIVQRIAGIMAPFLGAVVLLLTNQKVLIIVAVVMLMLSLVPLYQIRDIKDKPTKINKRFFTSWKMVRDYISLGFFGIHAAMEWVIWPMFIYLIFKTVESVAVLPIIVSLTSIVFIYFSSKIHKKDRLKMIALGSVLIGITWTLRIFVPNNIFYYVTVFLMGLFSVLITLPLDSNIFERGESSNPLAASTYRNAFSMFFRIFVFLILILLTEVFNFGFVMAAISMFVLMFLSIIIRKNVDVMPIEQKIGV